MSASKNEKALRSPKRHQCKSYGFSCHPTPKTRNETAFRNETNQWVFRPCQQIIVFGWKTTSYCFSRVREVLTPWQLGLQRARPNTSNKTFVATQLYYHQPMHVCLESSVRSLQSQGITWKTARQKHLLRTIPAHVNTGSWSEMSVSIEIFRGVSPRKTCLKHGWFLPLHLGHLGSMLGIWREEQLVCPHSFVLNGSLFSTQSSVSAWRTSKLATVA